MERAARERAEALLDEGGLAVDQARDLGAVLERAAGDRVDVVLVGLAEIARVGAGDRALVAHPGDGDGGVEAPGEGDADALADGEGLQDLRHGGQPTGRLRTARTGPLPGWPSRCRAYIDISMSTYFDISTTDCRLCE